MSTPEPDDGRHRADVPVNTRPFSFWQGIPGVVWVLWALVCVVVGTWVASLIPDEVDRAEAVADTRLCSEVAAPCLTEATVSLVLVEDDAAVCDRGCTYFDGWEVTDPDGHVHEVELDVRSSDWFGVSEGDGEVQALARLFRTSDDDWSVESLFVEEAEFRSSGWEPVSSAGWGLVAVLAVVVLFCLRTVVAVVRRLPRRIRIVSQEQGRRAAWWSRVTATEETRVDPHALPWAAAWAVGAFFVLEEAWLWALVAMVLMGVVARVAVGAHAGGPWKRAPSALWAAAVVAALAAGVTALVLLPGEIERGRVVAEQRICGVDPAPCLRPVDGTFVDETWGWFVRPDSDPTQELLLGTVRDPSVVEDADGEKVTLLVLDHGIHHDSAELLLRGDRSTALTAAGAPSITFAVAVLIVALRTVLVVGRRLRVRIRALRAVENPHGVWWGTNALPEVAAAIDPLLAVWWGTALAALLVVEFVPWWLYAVVASGVLLLAHAVLRAMAKDEAAGVEEQWEPPEGWRGPF